MESKLRINCFLIVLFFSIFIGQTFPAIAELDDYGIDEDTPTIDSFAPPKTDDEDIPDVEKLGVLWEQAIPGTKCNLISPSEIKKCEGENGNLRSAAGVNYCCKASDDVTPPSPEEFCKALGFIKGDNNYKPVFNAEDEARCKDEVERRNGFSCCSIL